MAGNGGAGARLHPSSRRVDIFFTPAGGEAYLRDLPNARLVRLDSGHFAVEDCLEQITREIVDFFDTTVKKDDTAE